MRKALVLFAIALVTCSAANADKVTRTVSSDGVPKISIRGNATRPKAAKVGSALQASAASPDFQVYDLDAEVAARSQPQVPVVVVVPSPPPIAPNAGAYGYGYGYGYGFPGYWGNPVGPVCPPLGPWGPGNFSTPPVNYQNRPVNYQNPPVNYQNRPFTPQRPQPRPWRR